MMRHRLRSIFSESFLNCILLNYACLMFTPLFLIFPCCMLFDLERSKMGSEVNDEEIRTALWSIKPLKAPSPDGLHVGFFQYFWHDVKAFVCHDVKQAFALGSIPTYLNTTLITFIPKCTNPESLANYRLISLCNSIYKVISKVLVARIRPLLSSLISPI